MDRHGLVGRQGPGCCSPDKDEGIAVRLYTGPFPEPCIETAGTGKLDSYGIRPVGRIFHLCLGQGSDTGGAPVNGLCTLHNVPIQKYPAELPGNGGLIAVIHGEIGIIPVPQDTKAFKFLPLNLYKFFSVFSACLPDGKLAHFLFLFPKLLLHVMLYGKAVTIPPWHKRSIMTGHKPGFYDDVLEYLVNRMSQVQMTIGIRRPIMEDKRWIFRLFFLQVTVKIHLCPALEHLRLALVEIRLHGEFCLGKVQGLFIFHLSLVVLKIV